MIELLGVGVARPRGRWLVRGVCASLQVGELTVVVSAHADERRALLDAATGRRIPDEGRVWVDRVPLMRASRRRIRALCGDVDPAAALLERRSLFWNVLAAGSGPRALGGLWRLPRAGERRGTRAALERVGLRTKADEPVARLSAFDRTRCLVARALARRPRYLAVREPDTRLGCDETGALLALLRLLARHDRLGIVVSLADAEAGHAFADRTVVLGDGHAGALGHERAARRAGAVTT